MEGKICELEDRQLSEGDGVAGRNLGLAYERRERILGDVDVIALIRHFLYWLIERCKTALRDPGASAAMFSLVRAGGVANLRVSLSERSNFDLGDAVCQRAKVCPNENVLFAGVDRKSWQIRRMGTPPGRAGWSSARSPCRCWRHGEPGAQFGP